MFVGNNRRATH